MRVFYTEVMSVDLHEVCSQLILVGIDLSLKVIDILSLLFLKVINIFQIQKQEDGQQLIIAPFL